MKDGQKATVGRRVRAIVRRAAIRSAIRWTVRSVRVSDGDLVVLSLPARISFAERCAIGEALGQAVGSLPARNVSVLMLPAGSRFAAVPSGEAIL